MNHFQEMYKNISSSPYHGQAMRFVAPLNDYLGINHFWYYQITNSGYYSYFGTHSAWNEYCFEEPMLVHFPCLRHPASLQNGIHLMKTETNAQYKNVLQHAWNKFKINLSVNVLKKLPDGIEAFGFGTGFNDIKADERLLNHLPLLNYFIKTFKEKQSHLFSLLDENQIDLASHFGPIFYERSKEYVFPSNRDQLLCSLGFNLFLTLTAREKDVLKLVSKGYTAAYISKQMHLSKRTVENYIATIKCKLSCHSKNELILRSQEVALTGFFD